MELKDFIKETLEQIVDGVSNASESIKSKGGVINPSSMSFTKDGQYNNFPHVMPSNVEFDVGLTATDKTGSTEGIGVFLGAINLGKKNEAGLETVAITRVKFTVPLVLPAGAALSEKYSNSVKLTGI